MPATRRHLTRFASAFFIAMFALELFSPLAIAYDAPVSREAESYYQRYYPDFGKQQPSGGNAASTKVPGPVSFAAAPAPAFAGTCSVSTQKPTEVKRIWDSALGFTGMELNSLPDNALLRNNPTQFTNQTNGGQVVVNNFISTGNQPPNARVPVSDVARLLGKSPEEVANDFAVDPQNGSISMQMFQAEADKNPALSKFLGSFSSLIASSPLSDIERAAYTNYKIKLPNGRVLPLSEVFNLQDVNGNQQACMLDDSFVQGRVSYIGQLNRDLLIGFDKSPTTLKSNQHVTSANTFAALSLNGGSSVVVPLRYQRFLTAIKRVLEVDTVLTLVETTLVFTSKLKADEVEADVDKLNERMSVLQQARDPVAWNDLVGDVDKSNLQSYLVSQQVPAQRVVGDFNDVTGRITRLDNALAGAAGPPPIPPIAGLEAIQAQQEIAILKAKQNQLAPALTGGGIAVGADPGGTAPRPPVVLGGVGPNTDLKAQITANEPALTQAYGFNDVQKDEVTREIQRRSYEKQRVDKLAEKSGLPSEAKNIQRVYNYLQSKLMNNFIMGFAWLGAGRFGLSIANALTFSSADSRLADNYVLVYVDRNDVLKSFRDSTNWLLSGRVMEVVSSVTKSGAPREIFGVGPMIFINSPLQSTTDTKSAQSATSVVFSESEWQISSDWKGRSDATVFEDIRDDPAYARMPLFINNMTTGMNLQKNNMYADYYAALGFLAPILAWKLYKGAPEEAFIPISRLLFYDIYVGNVIDPVGFDKNTVCDDKVVNKYINFYLGFTAVGQVANIVNTAFWGDFFHPKWLKGALGQGTSSIDKLWGGAINAATFISPTELGKMWAASEGFQYTQTCRDTSYTVVGYQPLDKKPQNGLAQLRQRLSPLQSSGIIGNLSFGSALAGVGQSLSLETMQEIVNLRSTMDEQQGMVRPKQLFYLHLDGAQEVSWGIYSSLESGGCFRKCMDDVKTAICMDDSGTYLIDKKTGARIPLSDRDRALMSTLMQDLARTIIPNTLISASLSCGAGTTMLQARADAHLYGAGGCATSDCLISQLSALANRPITGGDISQVMGNVVAIKTTGGIAFFESGKPIRFVYSTGTEKRTKTISPLGPGFYEVDGVPVAENDTQFQAEDVTRGFTTETVSKAGTETMSPSLETLDAVAAGNITASSAVDAANINIKGDGKVTLSGYVDGVNFDELDVGTLESIVMRRGRIEYDAAQNRLVAGLYILGEGDFAKSIEGISVSATKNVDENGTQYDAIKVGQLVAKPGSEDVAAELNNALKQAQGTGGFQMFETKDHTYYFTKNAAGEDILKVCDNNTKVCTDYKITGQVTSDGKTVTVPTDKGPFTFEFGTNPQTGFPELRVNGPDGFREIATLLAARGQGGIFVFDPTTGLAKILNGQDIPLNRDFATKGISYFGTPEGTRGIPADSLVDLRRSLAYGQSQSNPFAFLAMPSVPKDDPLVALLMLLGVFGAVLAIRAHVPGKNRRR